MNLLAHLRWLPGDWRTEGRADPSDVAEGVLSGWREVLRNRPFLALAAGCCTYQLCYDQLYLALPVELTRATGSPAALGALFAVAAVLVLLLQLRIAARARRAGPARALPAGFALMAAPFAVVAGCAPLAPLDGVRALAPAVGLVLLLHLGEMTAVPVARDLVARLAGERRLGAHFGLLASAGGAAVLVGSTGIGALPDLAREPGPAAAVPWLVLTALPAASAGGLWLLTRRVAPPVR